MPKIRTCILISSLNNYDFLSHVLIFNFHVVYNDIQNVIVIFTPKLISIHHCLSLLKLGQKKMLSSCVKMFVIQLICVSYRDREPL